MKVAIVDDDIIFAKSFAKTLKEKWRDGIESINVFLSAESFLSGADIYDILFLDIEMPGLTGIELARKHSNTNTKIVFVTNRDDLVFEAYNTTGAIGFVRKFSIDSDLKDLIQRINRNNQQSRCLSVKSGDTIIKIKYSDIIYIEKVAHNIVIRTPQCSYNKRTTIADLEPLLTPYGFIRSHVGYLVNLAHIELIKSNHAILTNGEAAPISRTNIRLVRDKFLERNVELNE